MHTTSTHTSINSCLRVSRFFPSWFFPQHLPKVQTFSIWIGNIHFAFVMSLSVRVRVMTHDHRSFNIIIATKYRAIVLQVWQADGSVLSTFILLDSLIQPNRTEHECLVLLHHNYSVILNGRWNKTNVKMLWKYIGRECNNRVQFARFETDDHDLLQQMNWIAFWTHFYISVATTTGQSKTKMEQQKTETNKWTSQRYITIEYLFGCMQLYYCGGDGGIVAPLEQGHCHCHNHKIITTTSAKPAAMTLQKNTFQIFKIKFKNRRRTNGKINSSDIGRERERGWEAGKVECATIHDKIEAKNGNGMEPSKNCTTKQQNNSTSEWHRTAKSSRLALKVNKAE